MKNLLSTCALMALIVGAPVMAQAQTATDDPNVPGHPRVNEVDQRLENQQDRSTAGVQSGAVNANQENRDTSRDARVSGELSRDQAKDGGHVTKAQQARMNRQLNRNSKHIHRQKHKPAAPASAAAPAQ